MHAKADADALKHLQIKYGVKFPMNSYSSLVECFQIKNPHGDKPGAFPNLTKCVITTG